MKVKCSCGLHVELRIDGEPLLQGELLDVYRLKCVCGNSKQSEPVYWESKRQDYINDLIDSFGG
jgi:hypothetical protein